MISPLILAGALAVVDPTTSAYAQPAPVDVVGCSVSTPVTSGAYDNIIPQAQGVLSISFVNRAPKAVSSVQFGVSDGNVMQTLSDAGSFASGVTVDHEFAAPSSDDVACTVRSVSFADGSTWQSH